MSVRARLVALIVLVAMVPLAVSATTSLSIHRHAYRDAVEALFRTSADLDASAARTRVEQTSDSLLLLASQTIDWSRLTPAERNGAVALVYRQSDDVAVASLIDNRRNGLASAFVEPGSADAAALHHPALPAAALDAFAGHLPFDAALAHGVSLGEPFASGGAAADAPILPIAVRVSAGPKRPAWVIATGLSLRGVCAAIAAEKSAPGVERFLLDGNGRVLCGPAAPLSAFDASLRDASGRAPDHVLEVGGTLVARTDLPWGWSAIVREPSSMAFAASRRMGVQAAAWIAAGLLLAVAAGLLLARGIHRALSRLVEGTQQIARGRFDHRLPEGRDEFGRVAASFNEMGVQVQKRDAEIQAFNRELQQRVEDRTRDLKEAQAELIQSHKAAAIGALTAGMAHEINNPLAGVLGLTQLLRVDAEERGDEKTAKALRGIEKSGARIRDIVRALEQSGAGVDGVALDPVNVGGMIDRAIAKAKKDLDGIAIEARVPAQLPPIMGRALDLEEVLGQLFSNSRVALRGRPEPKIVVSAEAVDGQLVKIAVEDNGKGIAPENLDRIFEPFFSTKDDWTSKGLGLTVAFRTVRACNGTIKAASRPGEGTSMTLTFPVARKGAQIA